MVSGQLADWLQRTVRAQVLTPDYEQELARRMGPDLFGLLRLPPPPAFLDGLDLASLPPEHIAPLLRRISLTRPAPAPADLHPGTLAADPGPVTTTTRTPAQRRWAQPPATPQLPAATTIPHLIHAIWLGTPLPPDSRYAANLADTARRYAGHADIALWTDIPRADFTAAAAPPPAGHPDPHPDPHAATRAMATWARDNGIHLISVHEIFHAAQPMTLHAQYTAETNKQLPRGYAGASDHLRLDIIHLLGGIYTDGDNPPNPAATPHTLTTLIHDVTTSDHAFTLHLLPAGMNNDVIIAPARHPAIRLWQELARYRYYQTQTELMGSLHRMARRFSDHQGSLLRYCLVHRSGRVHHQLISLLNITVDDRRLVHVSQVLIHGSDLSWSPPASPPPPAPLTADQVTARLTRAITTLARQLISREGNLHLTTIAPVITALPDPDAAWTATLTLLTELTTTGAAPPVTSITGFRWNDDGTPQTLTLPPEAHALIDNTPHHYPWLGATLAAPGHPAWLLDETVLPARLRPRPAPTPLAPLRALTQTLTDPHGNPAGIRIPAPPGTPPAPAPPAPPGYATIQLDARHGQPLAGHHPITPEHLALLLHERGLAGRPILLTTTHHNPHTLHTTARHLAALLHQPTLTSDGPLQLPDENGTTSSSR